MTRRLLAGLFLCLVALSGCDLLWNLSNRGALRADLTDVLSRAGMTPSLERTGMIGSSRSGYAIFPCDPAQIEPLVRGLALGELDTRSESGFFYRPEVHWARQNLPELFSDPGQIQAYLREEPYPGDRLVLKSGSRFTYLFLIFHIPSRRVYVQVAYAYG